MAAVALIVVLLWPTGSVAQAPAITADGTLATVVGRLVDGYGVDAGTIRGNNLVHSSVCSTCRRAGARPFSGQARSPTS